MLKFRVTNISSEPINILWAKPSVGLASGETKDIELQTLLICGDTSKNKRARQTLNDNLLKGLIDVELVTAARTSKDGSLIKPVTTSAADRADQTEAQRKMEQKLVEDVQTIQQKAQFTLQGDVSDTNPSGKVSLTDMEADTKSVDIRSVHEQAEREHVENMVKSAINTTPAHKTSEPTADTTKKTSKKATPKATKKSTTQNSSTKNTSSKSTPKSKAGETK